MSTEKETDAKILTLSFRGEDVAVYDAIVRAAANDERSPSKYLVRFLRDAFDTNDDSKTATNS